MGALEWVREPGNQRDDILGGLVETLRFLVTVVDLIGVGLGLDKKGSVLRRARPVLMTGLERRVSGKVKKGIYER